MNSGLKSLTLMAMGNELVEIICDSRWLLLAITLCVIADFRYGWGESAKHYKEAKEEGSKLLMTKYRWRTSRAVRRTMNKLIDYIIWVVMGIIFGMAVLKPLGIDYMLGGVVATVIAVACEMMSIAGHFMFLHGVVIEKKTIKGFIKAFIISLAKHENKDFGKAIEEGFKKSDEK